MKVVLYIHSTKQEMKKLLLIGILSIAVSDIHAQGAGSSAVCNIDINCGPGQGFQEIKKAVALINYVKDGNSEKCGGTGTLVNNTANDGRFLFLTAHHVVGTANEAENATFYWNYENPDCNICPANYTDLIVTTGATILATSRDLDFTLLELNGPLPPELEVYFAGWDASLSIAQNTICIHHPNGDAKKISLDYDSPVTDNFNISGIGQCVDHLDIDMNTHWKVIFDEGTIQSVSSGSALLNPNKQVIGVASGIKGISDVCEEERKVMFQKFSHCWSDYENVNQQLKAHLDPLNTGVLNLGPYIPEEASAPDYNTSATSSAEVNCQSTGTGDYCFTNNSSTQQSIDVWKDGRTRKVVINSMQSKCLYSLKSGFHFYKIRNEQGRTIDKGEVWVEKCKSKTYEVRN